MSCASEPTASTRKTRTAIEVCEERKSVGIALKQLAAHEAKVGENIKI